MSDEHTNYVPPPMPRSPVDGSGSGQTENVDLSDPSRLTNHYPAAYKDFFGLPSNPPCVYKTGPAWRERTGPEAYRIAREARPVHDHPITEHWHTLGTRIYELLDSQNVQWTSLDPVAFAEEGAAEPFCPLLVWIGVRPGSLPYDAAVAAAAGIKTILADAGFPEVEVAFRESVVTRFAAPAPSGCPGPKLLPLDSKSGSFRSPLPELRKPFTPALGLSIALERAPHCEGTGALYLRVGSGASKRTVLLTAAHVARPPPALANMGTFAEELRRRDRGRERIVVLGTRGYSIALTCMMCAIGRLADELAVWADNLARLAEDDDDDENQKEAIARKRVEYEGLMDAAKRDTQQIDQLHTHVTKLRTTEPLRVVGGVLCAAPVGVGPLEGDGNGAEAHPFVRDWALVELYEDRIDWDSFPGNKVYVGGNLSSYDYRTTMFPRPSDRAGYKYPRDGLLQACAAVPDAAIRAPPYVDAAGRPCLPVVKHGLGTRTTVGRACALASFVRFPDCPTVATAVAVLPYDGARGAFSGPGDSGAIVLERGGGVVGMLIGGASADGGVDGGGADVSYLTPYWWLEREIQKVVPGCCLYEGEAGGGGGGE